MDAYTAGTVIRAIFQSAGPKIGAAIVALAGLGYVAYKLWTRTPAEDPEAADRRARAALHIKRDAEEDARVAAERASQTAFLQEQVRASEERERGFIKVLTESAATMVSIREALQQTMTQGAERHDKIMQKLNEMHVELVRPRGS